MNVLINPAVIVIRKIHHVIFATWLHSNLVSFQTSLCSFFVIEFMQQLEKRDRAFEKVPKFIRRQQMCSKREDIKEMNIDLKAVASDSTCNVRSL